uniref:Vesicle-fusing ATPase n=1 Tax=Timema bartmani TaxID=61472 RepID=A0A7R9FAM3_9NEOP|nr:unnamed protein product [Timema bartmani]
MKVSRCPTDELTLTNCAAVNRADFPDEVKHVEVTTGPSQHFVFSIKFHNDVPRGTMGFSLLQRKWATLSIGQDIDVRTYHFDPTSSSECLCTVMLEVDFLQKKTTTLEPYDSDAMAREFLLQFSGQAFTVGQLLAFNFSDDKKLLGLVVKGLEDLVTHVTYLMIHITDLVTHVTYPVTHVTYPVTHVTYPVTTCDIPLLNLSAIKAGQDAKPKKTKMGRCLGDTMVQFQKAESSSINLVGKAKGHRLATTLIRPLQRNKTSPGHNAHHDHCNVTRHRLATTLIRPLQRNKTSPGHNAHQTTAT